MKPDDIDKKLKNLAVPSVPPPVNREQVKLAIISSKKSARISLWLLATPVLVLLGGVCESAFNVLLPPWSIIKTYGHFWPAWVRMLVFVTVLIVLPLSAALVNLLSVLWINYDRSQKVLNIAIRVKKINIIILFAAGLLALLFIGHAVGELMSGHE